MGRDVTRLRPGDEVFGEAEGAFAEYVCAPADAVGPMPANLTFEQAAAVPLAGNLVNGASGGVGTFAVQIAKAFGAEVTGVCGTRNAELVRSLGADHVVDCSREDFTRAGRRYDLVFDMVGNRSLTDCRRVLAPGGTLVLSGGGVSEGGSLVGPMACW
ncbi:NAD(P)-dependent alcohol dehydrogenase [Streptomyces virginiae]|uniref:NAD(P)-dependent alcohol dehydrogenase n=1 Tax=Streptomyces virginiae TaxID=1961 RepID=UPI0034523B4A